MVQREKCCLSPAEMTGALVRARSRRKTHIIAIPVVEFQERDTNLKIFLPKNEHIQRKLLNFEFRINDELLKIWHHFSNKVI